MVSGSSCLLANLGLTAGIYNAHYDWNGQFFGLTVTGNVINSIAADWAIEFPSTSGSIGIVVSGNQIIWADRRRAEESHLLRLLVALSLIWIFQEIAVLGVFRRKRTMQTITLIGRNGRKIRNIHHRTIMIIGFQSQPLLSVSGSISQTPFMGRK